MKKKWVSERNKDVLYAIKRLILQTGVCPSIYELAQEVGLSTNTVCYHVRVLRKAGYLAPGTDKRREIRPVGTYFTVDSVE